MNPFLLAPAAVVDDALEYDDENDDNFDAQLKRARLDIPVITQSRYLNTSFVKPDTCVVERLFSQTNKVWTECRKSMTPAHTELLLLLKCNRDLWDASLVYKCRSNPRKRPNAVPVARAAPLDDEADADFDADADADEVVEVHQFNFLQEGEDADFWDDENIEIDV